jgi:hypothetical protein
MSKPRATEAQPPLGSYDTQPGRRRGRDRARGLRGKSVRGKIDFINLVIL